MSADLILKLALLAMTDDDAMPVLQDAIAESGLPRFSVAALSVDLGYLVTESIANNYASAVAAVLLFADWPTAWPLAWKAWTRTPAERFAEVGRLLDLGYITVTQARDLLDPPPVKESTGTE